MTQTQRAILARMVARLNVVLEELQPIYESALEWSGEEDDPAWAVCNAHVQITEAVTCLRQAVKP